MPAKKLFIVDTNVPIVANGSGEHSKECASTCAKLIGEIMNEHSIVLDDRWLIMDEYKSNLRTHNGNEISDIFLKWTLTNRENSDRCVRVNINLRSNDECDIVEFPSTSGLESFDREDRKFVAIAVAHDEHPPVLEAADSKWWDFQNELKACGVSVVFLCKADILATLKKKKARNKTR